MIANITPPEITANSVSRMTRDDHPGRRCGSVLSGRSGIQISGTVSSTVHRQTNYIAWPRQVEELDVMAPSGIAVNGF